MKKRLSKNEPQRGVPDREYEPSILENMTREEIAAAAAGVEAALRRRAVNSDLVRRIQAAHPKLTEAEILEAIGGL